MSDEHPWNIGPLLNVGVALPIRPKNNIKTRLNVGREYSFDIPNIGTRYCRNIFPTFVVT